MVSIDTRWVGQLETGDYGVMHYQGNVNTHTGQLTLLPNTHYQAKGGAEISVVSWRRLHYFIQISILAIKLTVSTDDNIGIHTYI